MESGRPRGRARARLPTISARGSSPLGWILALALSALYALWLGPTWLRPRLGEAGTALAGMALLWGCALGLLAVVRVREGRPLASLGLGRPTLRGAALAAGIGVVLSLLVPLLSLAAARVLPAPDAGGVIGVAGRLPAWLLLLGVATAAVTEEILFRAYPIVRFAARGRRPPLGALLRFVAFVASHAPGWNPAHVVGVVLPLGLALGALYLWRREVWFVMIVHAVVDLPLVALAFADRRNVGRAAR